MTNNGFTVLQFLLAWGWRFLTGYYIPGTNVTPAAFLLFCWFVYLVKTLLVRFFNVQGFQSDKSKESGDA